MKRRLFIVVAVAIVLAACGWLVYRVLFSNEELASKVEWSVVQAVEWQHRDKPSDGIDIVKMNEYSLAGIPVQDGRKKIWIMLNPQNPPYYKQLPRGNYRLSGEDLKRILESKVVVSTVENCLESHVDDLR